MHFAPILAIFGLNSFYHYKRILKLSFFKILVHVSFCSMVDIVTLTSDDNVPVLQFIVDIFEILKYSNNRLLSTPGFYFQ